MPEFQLDIGTKEAAETFCSLDSFTRGYIEAAFFTESGEPDNACYGKCFGDISPETIEQIEKDCTEFNLRADAWLHKAYTHGDMSYDMERAGNDFWYTRNGHGTGFWDRGLGAAGDKLSDIAHSFGTVDLYVGDDGQIWQ